MHHRVQDDVRLAKYEAELARPQDGVGEAREACVAVAGPRDDVEKMLGQQRVAFVTKILDTGAAFFTESGRRV